MDVSPVPGPHSIFHIQFQIMMDFWAFSFPNLSCLFSIPVTVSSRLSFCLCATGRSLITEMNTIHTRGLFVLVCFEELELCL